jgi:hypothetical protein
MSRSESKQIQNPEPNVSLSVKPVPDGVVDDVVRELNELSCKATLELTLEMGRIIVNRFYDGDLTAWRHSRAKEVSFRRLAARTDVDLRVSATFLYRAVALYELTCRLSIGAHSRLTTTHLRAVVGLPEAHQAGLLENAEVDHWSTERLEREATKVRATLDHRRGRPASPTLLRAVRKLVRSSKHIESAIEDQDVQNLSDSELRSLYRAMDEVRGRLEMLARRLAGKDRNQLETPPPARRSGTA